HGRSNVLVIDLPFPTSLLPYLGPLLLALLLVKLYQPRKDRGFWLLHVLALLQACVGCVLDSGPLLGALLVAYLACGLGCVALHALRSERSPPPRPAFAVLPFAVRWVPGVAAVGLGLFLTLPRANWHTWDPQRQFGVEAPPPLFASAQTGFARE